MAQVVRFTRALSNTMVTDIQTALDAGSDAMTINLYDGTMPATPETGISSQVLLATCPSSSSTVCATQTGGTSTFAAITTATAQAFAGSPRTATWARFATSAGVSSGAVFDCNVGVVGSGAFIEMITTAIVASGPVAFTSGSITFP